MSGIPVLPRGRVDCPVVTEHKIRQFRKQTSTHTLEDIKSFVTIAQLEAMHISKALKFFDGNMTVTAKALGIGKSTLYKKVREYGLETK